MQLPIQSQSALFALPWERTAGPEGLAAVARQAEESGFFYVGVCDHTVIPRRLADTMGTTWYDTVATLGWLAGITKRTRLLSHVYVAALRHPLRAAKEFATLDQLSGGRVLIGVGAGHVAEEFTALDRPFEERGALLDEAIDGLAAGLTEEFPVLSGPTWPAADLGVSPRPVQDPRPPIWVGGSSPAALRRAALRGDGWLPQGTPRRALPGQIAELTTLRATYRDGDPLEIGTITEWLHVGEPTWELPKGTVAGSPQRIAESLGELVAMGVSHLQVRFANRDLDELCDQMAAFGEQVGPLLSR
jgi:probable F420-dependent oxidoreductase